MRRTAAACQHEGAIGMVDGKAVLLKDDYYCGMDWGLSSNPPHRSHYLEEREAAAYDEAAVKASHVRVKKSEGRYSSLLSVDVQVPLWLGPMPDPRLIPNLRLASPGKPLIPSPYGKLAVLNGWGHQIKLVPLYRRLLLSGMPGCS